MTKDVKYYRDLKPDETLQAGDERLCIVSLLWSPVAETAIGWQVVDSSPLYRRPVDAVPREEYEQLQNVLAEVRYLHGQAMHDRDILREELKTTINKCDHWCRMSAEYEKILSQPRLQPVTPEAMAELKDQETPFILFRHKEEPAFRFERVEYSKFSSLWLDVDGYEINPFDWQWFIVPSAIPEVQQ